MALYLSVHLLFDMAFRRIPCNILLLDVWIRFFPAKRIMGMGVPACLYFIGVIFSLCCSQDAPGGLGLYYGFEMGTYHRTHKSAK